MATVPRFDYEALLATSLPAPRATSSKRYPYEFGIAYGDPDTVPLHDLLEAIGRALQEDGRELAKYPHRQGYPPLRELIAAKLAKDRNIRISPDDIMLGDGSGQPIHMLCEVLLDAGDVVLTEDFTFNGTLNSMRRFRADIRGVACDAGGMIPEALDSTHRRAIAEGKRPKFIYVVPTFQNPQGWEMSLERRQAVLRLSRHYEVPILEDDCYVDLRFAGEPVTSMHALDDTGRVLYAGSFSKTIAPGIRMGYVTAPPVIMERMKVIRGGWVNEFAALAVHRYALQHLEAHIGDLNTVLRQKKDAMVAALEANFGSAAAWTNPPGGMYIWLTLPAGTDVTTVYQAALDAGVAYQPGPLFAADGVSGKHCLRLTFGYNTVADIPEGIAVLAKVFAQAGLLKN
jgi:2-aminoadipate transaminase